MERKAPVFFLAAAALAGASLTSSVAVPGAAQSSDEAAEVVVIVAGLHTDSGFVVGGLYEGPTTWLHADQAAEDCHAPIVRGRARCVFRTSISPSVAFAGFHDEDGDNHFDRDFIGLPAEGWAFSNDAREPFGPPSFERSSFHTASTVVHIHYGI